MAEPSFFFVAGIESVVAFDGPLFADSFFKISEGSESSIEQTVPVMESVPFEHMIGKCDGYGREDREKEEHADTTGCMSCEFDSGRCQKCDGRNGGHEEQFLNIPCNSWKVAIVKQTVILWGKGRKTYNDDGVILK